MAGSDQGLEAARAARRKAQGWLDERSIVCAVGIGRKDGVHVVKLSLEAEPPADARLPSEIDGVPVIVEVTGKVLAQTDP